MPRRRRQRRSSTLRWGGIAIFLTLLLAAAIEPHAWLSTHTREIGAAAHNGQLVLWLRLPGQGQPPFEPHCWAGLASSPTVTSALWWQSLDWRFKWSHVPPSIFASTVFDEYQLRIPLWALLLAAALPTSLAWRAWMTQRRSPSRCPKCNYDLRGLPTPLCPECGHAPPPTP